MDIKIYRHSRSYALYKFHAPPSFVQSSSLSAFLSDLKLTRCGPLLLRGVAKIRETGGHDLAGERGGALNGVRFLWLKGVSGRNTGVGRGVGMEPDMLQSETHVLSGQHSCIPAVR